MSFTNPILNALMSAVLGVLLVVWWTWDDVFVHRYWMLFIAISCAILGYRFGEPFINLLLRGR